MQEIKIDKSELERLIGRLDTAPEVLREAKKQAVAAAAPKLKQALDSQIGGAGKVLGWQGLFVGSKGGYAAVRPKAKTYIETKGKRPSRGGPKKYAVGYVTNAVNSGHRFPSPSGAAKRYKPRIKSGQMNVPGKQFYKAAEAQLCQIDPVRSSREGKDCYLLPANSTLTAPPEFDPKTQKAVWDGAVWRVEDIPQPEPEPDPTPDPQPDPGEQLTVLTAAATAFALTSVSIPDTQALSMAPLFPTWADVLADGAQIDAGRIIKKDGQLYRVVQSVTPQAHQEPGGEGMLAIYRPIDKEHAGTLDDPIPWVYGMDCLAGLYYSYNGAIYRVADGGNMIPCVWAPDTPGLWQWKKVEEG